MDTAVISIAEANQRTTDPVTNQDNLRKGDTSQGAISNKQVSGATQMCNPKSKSKVDFSIEAILSSRPTDHTRKCQSPEEYRADKKERCINSPIETQFSWVYCTRYRPPKLPSKQLQSHHPFAFHYFHYVQGVKREMNLRTRYRNPRIPFSTNEVSLLERKFIQSPYLGSNDVNELAEALNMSPKRVSSNLPFFILTN